MNNIKAAFDSVRASGELKGKTLAFVSERSRNYSMRKAAKHLKILPAAAAAAAVFFGIKLYFTPTTHINIDINPSLDLGINLFDRVVSVNALNEDGARLLNGSDLKSLKFASYDEALRRILDDKSIEVMLSEDGIMTVTVIETNTRQSADILSAAEACVSGYGDVRCHSISRENASAASKLGLSCEKYLMYLNLSAADPEITPEGIRNMTMREIRELTAQLTEQGGHHYEGSDDPVDPVDNNNSGNENISSTISEITEPGHHGNGHSHGYVHG